MKMTNEHCSRRRDVEREDLQRRLKKPGSVRQMCRKATGAKLGEAGIASAEERIGGRRSSRRHRSNGQTDRTEAWRRATRSLPPIACTLNRDRRPARSQTGSIRAKAQWEVVITAREFLEAASLGSQPQAS